MAASFQKKQAGLDHQVTIPNVLPPESLLSDIEQLAEWKEKAPQLYKRATLIHPNAIEFRPVEKWGLIKPKASRPFSHVWIRAREKVSLDLPMQQQMLAYASDYGLLRTATLPHRDKIDPMRTFYASLDHAIWFHRDFAIDEWLLYATDSPSASNSRGFTRGNIFNKAGQLVASVAQEGLIRQLDKKP